MRKLTFILPLLLTTLFLSGFAQAVTIESDARINYPVTHEQAEVLARYINSSGYNCKSVSMVREFSIKNGWHVWCNNSYYKFEVEDNGGRYNIKSK